MKIGVSLYSFHAYAGEDSLGMKGCIAKAKEIGCEGVDFVETQHESQEAYLAHAREIGAYCREMGVEAVCFCVGSDFLNGSGGDVDAEIARVKGRVDIAAAYGCKLMRHDATPGYPNDKKFGRSFDAVLPILTKAYREVTEYAEQKGVKTCIENHGFFAQDAERVEKLINAVGHPNFGALVDIGNFACADEDSAARSALWRRMPSIRMRRISIRRTAASTTPAKAGSSPAPAITSAARSSVTATCRSDSASTRFAAAAMTGI